MTFEKAFEAIKKKFNNAIIKDIPDFALQITLSDEDCGGTFYIAVQNGVLDIMPYDYRDNNAVLDILKSDFNLLLSGRKSIQKVIDNGASLKGDISVIENIKKIIASTKKTSTKKAVAKKGTTKKTVTKKSTSTKSLKNSVVANATK